MSKKIDFVRGLKDMSESDLRSRIQEDELRLKKLEFAHAISPLENPMSIRGLRRDLSRLKTELQKNNLDAFGEIIHENWELKRSLTRSVSNSTIDEWYRRARQAGAVGGKLLGAGSGGFLMFYAPRERHEAIARELKKLRRMDFRCEPQGSKIIFVHD